MKKGGADALAGREAKVVLLGAQGVGKTSLATRYVRDIFAADVKSTVGAAFLTKRLTIGTERIKLQIWDTAGQERFRAIAPMYYRGADAAILVYDVTKADSLEMLKTWVADLKRNEPGITALFVVGNKADMQEARQVPTADGQAYATTLHAVFAEVSAKDSTGLDELFLAVGQSQMRPKRKGNNARTMSVTLGGSGGGSGPDSPDDTPSPGAPSGTCC